MSLWGREQKKLQLTCDRRAFRTMAGAFPAMGERALRGAGQEKPLPRPHGPALVDREYDGALALDGVAEGGAVRTA